ncbi:MAG TPA: pre-peptidase C-terminal domain-containing protein [Candidatus Thermoplasmatota archaeon]|nr:pre-peptidase C-terminal domain-containing protein [Candidatus Thermoplasmatota archaeon]
MSSGKDSTKSRIEAVVIALLFIGTALIVPVSTMAKNSGITTQSQNNTYTSDDNGPFVLDRSYYLRDPNPAAVGAGDNDDAGYKKDAGTDITHSLAIYPGEVIDETPGRGREGKLTSSDTQDWFGFSMSKGQTIAITMTPPNGFNFDLSLSDAAGNVLATSSNSGSTIETINFPNAPYAGKYFMRIYWVSGSGSGRYSFTVTLVGQNDANSGTDAGNTLATALTITPGTYFGYLDMNDPYDFYKFQADQGKGIHLKLAMKSIAYLSDFDLQLYDPNGKLVYAGNQYYDDDLLYPATIGGIWEARVDIYPGWVDCPHPTTWSYYSYGSGAYNLTLILEASATLPSPIPEPQITPIAKTFKITNDPSSTKDDFAYLAAIPACNYLDNGKRYLAPIIYTGDTTPTAYYDDPTGYGTVNDMTQYLVDDWNTYLATYGKNPTEYIVPTDPIQAASEIAKNGWSSSNTAVVAVDGSSFNDTTKTVLKKTATLKREVSVEDVPSSSSKLMNLSSSTHGYLTFIGPKWGALNVNVTGITTTSGSANGAGLTQVIAKFMNLGSDDWPTPYDGTGNAGDIYMPVTQIGYWYPYSDFTKYQFSHIIVTKIAGDRYHFKVNANDAVINAVVSTTQPSDLLVFLIDPQGNLRSPIIPAWNGPVNPMFQWNGLENPAVNPWRSWNVDPHTEFSAQVLHPETGKWTVIVVPRYATGADVKYTLTTTVRTVNPDRADATMSAANAAVIASLNHLPLLYVTKNSVPAATTDAFTKLGVHQVIFVERNNIGSAVRGSLTIESGKDLTTMQAIVDEIKSSSASENYITLTSLKTGDGYFAPAAMLAAYHGSPVLRVEDSASGDAAAVAERIQAWQRWAGDYYHGSRANGHMPDASVPVDQNRFSLLMTLIKFALGKVSASDLPPLGLDAKRYWNQEMFNDTHNYVVSLGLDKTGQEGYAVVAPRGDINMELHSVLMGNNSYAGDIPGITPAYSSDIVVRDILYPALIYANPGRDVTTASLMNYPEGMSFGLNDHKSHSAYSSSVVKNTFNSHFRTYDGHTLWNAYIQRMNEGASVYYYSGHGTGGSGMAEMYEQTSYSSYPDQVWWDGWRGYMYDNWKNPRDCLGLIWFNPEPPNLYDIIHYKWVDQQLPNLHSQAIYYMSCTTADGACPMVYLEHGAIFWYGNANTGLCPEADIGDDAVFQESLVNGVSIGVAWSHQVWLHYRDFTTGDTTSMYGPASMTVESIQNIYGDPALIVYSPEWTSPVPIDAS